MTRTTSYYTTPVQEGENVVEIEREDGYMNPLLFDLLSHRTPHGYESYIRKDVIIPFLDALKPAVKLTHETDTKGNLIVHVGQKPVTMFSSHMDTVHWKSNDVDGPVILLRTEGTGDPGKDDYVYGASALPVFGFKNMNDGVIYDESELGSFLEGGFYRILQDKEDTSKWYLWKYKYKQYRADDPGTRMDDVGPFERVTMDEVEYDACVLGADDKVGVYVMCRMIEANVPGLYVFHVGEEVGGKGSQYLVTNAPERVKGIKHCVAFDRRGHTDIIRNQSGGQCASQEFTTSLKEELDRLSPPKVKWDANATGTFTDSALYTHLIPECTNVSIGYYAQHSSNECFDHFWLENFLIPALTKIEWGDLPAKRPLSQPNRRATVGSTYSYNNKGNVTNTSYISPPTRESASKRINPLQEVKRRMTNAAGGMTITYGDFTFKYFDSKGDIVYAGYTQDLATPQMLEPKDSLKHRMKETTTSWTVGSDTFHIIYADGHWDEYTDNMVRVDSSYEVIDHSSGSPVSDQADEDHWESANYCAPWKVDKDTPSVRIPPWRPSFGMYPRASEEQMAIIIKNYMKMYHNSEDATAKMIARMVKRMHHLEGLSNTKLH